MADNKEAFTEQYTPLALKVGAALDVAPSVLLGQWGLETGWGKSVIPGTNNLGNIKDFSGGGVSATDNMTKSKDKYVSFSTPEDFGDHYVDLIKRKYPGAVGAMDATQFANALKKGGYAEDPNYVSKLVGAQMAVPKASIERIASVSQPSEEPDWSQYSDEDLARIAGVDLNKTAAPDQTNFGDRVLHGVGNALHGGAQFLAHITPEPITQGINSGAAWLNENLPITESLGIRPASPKQLDQQIQEREKAYQYSRGENANTFDVGALIGEIAPQLPIGIGGAIGAGLKGAALAGAGAGGVGAAISPITNGAENYAAEKAKNIASGIVTGGIAGPAASIAGKSLSKMISPNVSEDVQKLMAAGITPTPGQILGSRASKVEEALQSYPFLGGAISNARNRAVEDLNDVAFSRAAGEGAPSIANDGLRGSLDKIQKSLSSKYDDILPKATLNIDDALSKDLKSITDNAMSLPKDQSDRFLSVLGRTLGEDSQVGSKISGENFKKIESSLRNEISTASKSPDPYTRDMADNLRKVRDSLRKGLVRSNPKVAKDLKEINTGWANYSVLRKAASRSANPDSPITVAALQSAVKANDNTVGKGGFSAGKALMQDLTDPAVAVLGNKVPDSGTATRGLLGAAGLGYISPTALGVGALGSLLYTKTGQKLLANLLTKRPEAAKGLSSFINASSLSKIGGALSGKQ